MGFFDDIETPVSDIPTGYGLPVNTYPVVIQSAKPFKKKNGASSLLIKFAVTEGALVGQTDDWWINKPEREYAKDKSGAFSREALAATAKNAKRSLQSLGLTDEEMTDFDMMNPDHVERFIGLEGTMKVFQTAKQKGTDWKSLDFTLSNGESGVSDLSAEPTSNAEITSEGTEDFLDQWLNK